VGKLSTLPLSRRRWHGRASATRLECTQRTIFDTTFSGMDLAGNTFWEFKDARTATRFRRIVKYPRQTQYSDINISPQWHQWLRHTRQDPPSINEQQLDEIRQARVKQLAQDADQKWKQKPSYIEPPSEQPSPGLKLPSHAPQTRQPVDGTMIHNGAYRVTTQTPEATETTDTNAMDERRKQKGSFTGETQQKSPLEVETSKNPGDRSAGEEAWKPTVSRRR
jgi:NADH dehydrogenase [ubiquinone] 1 alpha subcomplex assembly factor 2